MTPRYLTKSRFKQAIECPTKLYYASHNREYRNTMQDNAFLQSLAEGGFQVGELAKRMHPGGHEITSKNHAIAEAETAEWLQKDEVTLFKDRKFNRTSQPKLQLRPSPIPISIPKTMTDSAFRPFPL